MGFDGMKKAKIETIEKGNEDFHRKLDCRILGAPVKQEHVWEFPRDVDLSRLLRGRESAYAERWTTSSPDNKCSESYMRSDIYPPYRKLFYEAWGLIRLFVNEGCGLRVDAAATIVHDLKIVHKIATEISNERGKNG